MKKADWDTLRRGAFILIVLVTFYYWPEFWLRERKFSLVSLMGAMVLINWFTKDRSER